MEDLRGMTFGETAALFESMGAEKFRAGQAFAWAHGKGAAAVDEMTDLPKDLRGRLAEKAGFAAVRIVTKSESADGLTKKYLFELGNGIIIDGEASATRVESVWMRHDYGAAACISTQAGCRMGCAFCVSGAGGLERHLTAGEMCAQLYTMARDTGERASRVVLMGSGEPLDNMAETLRFIEIINDKRGAGVGQRRITISTCGLTDKIDALAAMGLQATLAISLHAPNDEVRRALMPIAKAYPMDGLLKAGRGYAEKTGRRVTYEYAMIKAVNDKAEHAKQLAGKLKGTLCHVNLIPLNGGRGGYATSGAKAVGAFADILRGAGVETTTRKPMGADVSAACGQLKSGFTE